MVNHLTLNYIYKTFNDWLLKEYKTINLFH